jgi:hypothetical protein
MRTVIKNLETGIGSYQQDASILFIAKEVMILAVEISVLAVP